MNSTFQGMFLKKYSSKRRKKRISCLSDFLQVCFIISYAALLKNNFETVFLLRVYFFKLKHQKRLGKSCIEEAYTLTKKGHAFPDIFQQTSLDFKQFLMVFFNSKKSCLTEIIQMTYLVIHEISCRYFFNGLSVHRGYNYLPK